MNDFADYRKRNLGPFATAAEVHLAEHAWNDGRAAATATAAQPVAIKNAMATLIALYVQAMSAPRTREEREAVTRWKAWALAVANAEEENGETCTESIDKGIAALAAEPPPGAATPIAPEDAKDAARWRFFEKHAQDVWHGRRLIYWMDFDGVMKYGSRAAVIDAAMAPPTPEGKPPSLQTISQPLLKGAFP